jgi:hypothetical protein
MSPAEQERDQQASIPFQVHHKDLNLCEIWQEIVGPTPTILTFFFTSAR